MDTARKVVTDNEWIPLTEAAQLLGESRATTLHRIVRGEAIEVAIVAGRTLILRASIDTILAAREATERVRESVEDSGNDVGNGLGG